MDASLRQLVEDHYGEPQRHYHTIEHVNGLLTTAQRCGYDKPFRKLNLFPTFSAAIVFHDIIYDPKAPKGQNETESAVLAKLCLADMDTLDFNVGLVCRMIEATIDHQADEPFIQDFLDLDLSILAAEPPAYVAYVQAIRREYSHVDLDTYVAGRTDFLSKMLERDRLFFHEGRGVQVENDYYGNFYHGIRSQLLNSENAHRNITSEIAYLKRSPRRYLNEPIS